MIAGVEEDVRAGDVIQIHPPGVGQPSRTGLVLEVLGRPGHRRYRVEWDPQHESIFYPAGGATVRRVQRAAAAGR